MFRGILTSYRAIASKPTPGFSGVLLFLIAAPKILAAPIAIVAPHFCPLDMGVKT